MIIITTTFNYYLPSALYIQFLIDIILTLNTPISGHNRYCLHFNNGRKSDTHNYIKDTCSRTVRRQKLNPSFKVSRKHILQFLLYRCLHFVQVSPKYIRDFTLFIHRTPQRLHNFISLKQKSLYLPRREKESDNFLLPQHNSTLSHFFL